MHFFNYHVVLFLDAFCREMECQVNGIPARTTARKDIKTATKELINMEINHRFLVLIHTLPVCVKTTTLTTGLASRLSKAVMSSFIMSLDNAFLVFWSCHTLRGSAQLSSFDCEIQRHLCRFGTCIVRIATPLSWISTEVFFADSALGSSANDLLK
jgi:hypothetical protein